jgi:hypothetical protein
MTGCNPLYRVLKGFLNGKSCHAAASLARDLHDAGEMTRNVFQLHTWVANIDRVADRRRPGDVRWRTIEEAHRKTIQTLDLRSWVRDSSLGDFISLMMPDGIVVRHRDDWQLKYAKDPHEYCQVRCNLFVCKEAGSGDPLVAADESDDGALAPLDISVSTGDMLVFSPTMSMHGTNRVRGGPRIMLSFGLTMTKKTFREVLERLEDRAETPLPAEDEVFGRP